MPAEIRTLQPLAEVTTRREAMSRCIGPLTSLYALGRMDYISANSDAIEARIRTKLHPHLDIRCIEVAGLAMAQTFEVKPFPVTGQQSELLNRYTYGSALARIVAETFEAQKTLTRNIAIPGYIACRDELSVENTYMASRATTASEGVRIMRNPAFGKLLCALSIGCNGSYKRALALSEHSKPTDILNASEITASIPDKENLFLDITDVCEKDKDGTIAISKKMTNALSTLMKIDRASYHINYQDGMRGSTGCPARKRFFKVRSDDFTDTQWQMLTEGVNPVASYDQDTQRLEMLRNPILEYNDLLADNSELTQKLQGWVSRL